MTKVLFLLPLRYLSLCIFCLILNIHPTLLISSHAATTSQIKESTTHSNTGVINDDPEKNKPVEPSPKEKLIDEYNKLMEQIQAAEKSLIDVKNNMEGKTGEELTSSELRQFQKGQELIHLYMNIIKNLVEQKALLIDTSDKIKSIQSTFLSLNKRIISAINIEDKKFNERTKDLIPNSDSYFLKFKSHNEYQSIALDALVDYNKNLEQLNIQDSHSIKTLHTYLKERAESLAGKIQLLATQKNQSTNNSTNTKEISKEQNLLNQRFDIVESSLKKMIALLKSQNLDATIYQRILMESTGTITKDILDIHVATTIFKEWTTKFKDLVKENGIDFIFKFILFSIILLITWIISKLIGRVIHRSFNRTGSRQNNLMQDMVVGLTTRLIFFLGFLFAVSQVGISLGPVLTGLGIAGFIVGFALQDTLSNFASGIMILIYRPYDVGDVVEVGTKVFGSVNSMNLVSTTIMTFDNQTLVLPNSKIWGDVIKNITNQENRRVDLVFHAPLESNVDDMLKLLTECVNTCEDIIQTPEPTIKLHKITFNSLEFIVRPWVKTTDYWNVYWELHEVVKRRYDREGIQFPVQQNHVVIEKPA